MLGFIKKDLFTAKSNLKFLVLLMILYGFIGISGGMDISYIVAFVSMSVMTTTFSYDSYNNFNAYSTSFPNGRINAVKSKYIATILMILVLSIVTFAVSLLILCVKHAEINFMSFATSIVTIAVTLIILAIIYPIIFKFGIEKARIAMFAVVFGVVALFLLLIKILNSTNSSLVEYIFSNPYILILLSIVIVIATVYLSYRISLKIYMKKEF